MTQQPIRSFGAQINSYGGTALGVVFSSFGKFFSKLFPLALDLNGDGVQLAPTTEGNNFFDMASDGYQHLTACTAPRKLISSSDVIVSVLIHKINWPVNSIFSHHLLMYPNY